jgi:hypothetical protein
MQITKFIFFRGLSYFTVGIAQSMTSITVASPRSGTDNTENKELNLCHGEISKIYPFIIITIEMVAKCKKSCEYNKEDRKIVRLPRDLRRVALSGSPLSCSMRAFTTAVVLYRELDHSRTSRRNPGQLIILIHGSR